MEPPAALVEETTSLHRLADGAEVLVRPLLHSDRDALAAAYRHLSPESRRLRFFAAPAELSEEDLEYLTNLDYTTRFALAAFTTGSEPRGVGVARYVRSGADPARAEAAVTVLDEYQRRGIGTLLLVLLADHAQRAGVTTLVSYILWENEELLLELRELGAVVEPDEPGVARVEIDIAGVEEPARSSRLRAMLRHFATEALARPVRILSRLT
jgi:GNAT superfamily N-acetyltransferase